MAFSKAHRFNPVDYHYALVCGILSHPARMAIVRKLDKEGTCTPKELMAGMPISQPAFSQHLEILRRMQIVECEQQFPTVHYWLNQDLSNTQKCLIDLILQAGKHFDTGHISELNIVGGPIQVVGI